MSTIVESFEAMKAWMVRARPMSCRCIMFDASRCCSGACECHREPATATAFTVKEYATAPHALMLGEGMLRATHCHLCGGRIRPLSPKAVRHEGPRRWRHVECGGPARAARGGRTLEKLLRESVKEVRRGS